MFDDAESIKFMEIFNLPFKCKLSWKPHETMYQYMKNRHKNYGNYGYVDMGYNPHHIIHSYILYYNNFISIVWINEIKEGVVWKPEIVININKNIYQVEYPNLYLLDNYSLQDAVDFIETFLVNVEVLNVQ